MEPSGERACPNCAAPTQARQRWCLECGTEVRRGRRAGLRSTVGIATTLAVLVGAGSAAGYTLLQDGKEPPPPATTVAQAPPTTTPPATTQQSAPYTPPAYTPYKPPSNNGTIGGPSTSGGAEDGAGTTGTGTTPYTNTGTGHLQDSTGTGDPTTGGTDASPQTIEPQLTLTDVALGAVAVVYAPYTTGDVDLGDASRVVDGTTRTVWKTPVLADPSAAPQTGVYVDLASREEIRKLVVRTPTPGISIEVYGARTGPPTTIVDDGWDHLATRENLPAEAKIKLPKRPYRYILVWVTGLPPDGGRAAISELSLLSLQPE